MNDYYELLSVSRTAQAGDIKQAYRREMTRYHPDKVHHLGTELQDLAAARAAALTQAYMTLSDVQRRAEYDARLDADTAVITVSEVTRFCQERRIAAEAVRRAALDRLGQAVHAAFDRVEEVSMPGFDAVYVPTASRWRSNATPAIAGRLVHRVDAVTVAATIELARRTPWGRRDVYVLLMASELAEAAEMAAATAGCRRPLAPAGATLTVIPVSTGNWRTPLQADLPPMVAALLSRLAST